MILEAVRKGGGHPIGGPLLFTVMLAVLAGCGRGGAAERPSPERGTAAVRPLDIYNQLGLITGSDEYPAVAAFVALAGPAETSYVLFGLSLPNRALRFQREDGGFTAEYRVALSFERDGEEVERVERTERVRVPTYAETARTEESIIFQTLLPLAPGRYEVTIEGADVTTGRGFTAERTLTVPAFGGGAEQGSTAFFVYRAQERDGTDAEPDMILNPRHTIPFGGQTPLLYIETYNGGRPAPLTVRVLTEDGAEVWRTTTSLEASGEALSRGVVEIPATLLAVGRHWVEVGPEGRPAETRRTPLLVTISDQWMVRNFEEVLDFVSYIAYPQELDSLRSAEGGERNELWERFWERRNPAPASPVNEFREAFFHRVRVATEQLAEGNTPGWRTDRGRVYIVLGPPDNVMPRHSSRGAAGRQPDAIEWIYARVPGGRLELLFVDRSGIGRFEMTRNSEMAFRNLASRLRPRN